MDGFGSVRFSFDLGVFVSRHLCGSRGVLCERVHFQKAGYTKQGLWVAARHKTPGSTKREEYICPLLDIGQKKGFRGVET